MRMGWRTSLASDLLCHHRASVCADFGPGSLIFCPLQAAGVFENPFQLRGVGWSELNLPREKFGRWQCISDGSCLMGLRYLKIGTAQCTIISRYPLKGLLLHCESSKQGISYLVGEPPRILFEGEEFSGDPPGRYLAPGYVCGGTKVDKARLPRSELKAK